MDRNKKTIVLSLGGSLIVPAEIDVKFLRNFKKNVEFFVKKGNRAVIVCGGGGTNRRYNFVAKSISKPCREDLDWLGIAATKLNAEFVRVLFGKLAYQKVVTNPTDRIKTGKKIIVASGWKPGWSSDYDAVLLAAGFGANQVVNLTNVDYVYTKDPRKFSDAIKLENLTWKEYLSIVGKKWKPRMSVPFDPIAAQLAMEKGISVAIVNGAKTENLKSVLQGRKVKGTVIK